MVVTPSLGNHSTSVPNPESLSAVSPEIEFAIIKKMYVALCIDVCAEKKTFFGKDE